MVLTPLEKQLADKLMAGMKAEHDRLRRENVKLQSVSKKLEETERQRDWLVGKLVEMGEGHEHAVCPSLGTPCAPASYNCTICWLKAAANAE